MSTITLTPAQEKYYRIAQKLSSVLGRKWGVSVVFGHPPSTDGTTIHLPHWDMENPLAVRALYGCVAHEAGGHVAMTSFEALKAWCEIHRSEPGFATLKTIENICEDVRIEHHLFRKYPGVRHDMDAALEMVVLGDGEPATDYWPAVTNWMLMRFRSRLLGQSILDAAATASETVVLTMVDPAVLARADRLADGILALGPTKEDYRGILALAEKLFSLFDQSKPSAQPANASGAPFDASDGSDPSPEGAGPSAPGDARDGSSGGSGSSKSDGSLGAPRSEPSSKAEGSGPGAEPPETGSATGSATGAPAAPGSAVDISGGSGTSARRPPVDESYLDAVAGDVIGDLKAAMAPTQPLPLPAGTGAGLEPGQSGASDMTHQLQAARHLSGRLVPALAPLLNGDVLRDTPRRRGRSLIDRRLVESKAHPGPRVFEKRVIEEDESALVHLLVDKSTSTSGAVYAAITAAALGLGLALESFPSVETRISHFPGAAGAPFNATKTVERTVRGAAARWPVPSGGTPLAPAIRFSSLETLVSTKLRRILLVVTDGRPAEIDDCVRARSFACALGVEIYGVVVSTEAYPTHLFDDSERIRDVSGLPRAIERLVTRII
ncbi:MAG: hypothetical protein DI556_13495 [Rhodovulum sulfidophilum]|uniref:VWFA domain-containing protein n=1 Tax=Rhodovulum sulfidophilum TaxID=35806 RepID=A0A2W5N6V3_RHOSU|nr:MAG: hypothetical protein DI556_13495 [Rhodovulum sulfidophilum]